MSNPVDEAVTIQRDSGRIFDNITKRHVARLPSECVTLWLNLASRRSVYGISATGHPSVRHDEVKVREGRFE
jgi:hypothetical protein